MVATTSKRRAAKGRPAAKDDDDSALARRARAELNIQRQRLLLIEAETLERKRVPIDEVRTWARNLAAGVNRVLTRIGSLPDVTPAQAAWLAEFERQARTDIQGLG